MLMEVTKITLGVIASDMLGLNFADDILCLSDVGIDFCHDS